MLLSVMNVVMNEQNDKKGVMEDKIIEGGSCWWIIRRKMWGWIRRRKRWGGSKMGMVEVERLDGSEMGVVGVEARWA